MESFQAALQKLSEEFTALQKELSGTVQSRQKLEAQKTENEGVQKQFDLMEEDETIYKLVGTVLVKQDKAEAESTVKGRLDFISKEISRLDGEIKVTQITLEKKKKEIIQVQSTAQAAAANAAQA